MPPTMHLMPSAPRSRAEHLADDLTARLTGGSLRPGDRVGTLEDLRARTGYGRSTVSEAVRLLRERGVLEIRPGRGGGLFLAQDNVLVRMRRTLLAVESTPATLVEAVELREALEEVVATRAAQRCGPEEAARLRALAASLNDADADYELFLQRNWDLHAEIAQLCDNTMIRAVYGSCLGYLREARATYGDEKSQSGYVAARARVHHELVEAIITGEQEAIRRAVARHNDSAVRDDEGDTDER